jgi:peptidoglycan hydrolase-like protein with peptidoglycan-binding domain
MVFALGDDNIVKAQNRLKTEGFYFGNPTGVLDRETADALTRYQMDHGLAISGKLDKPTAKALRVSMPNPPSTPRELPTPRTLAGSWQRLPTGEMQFVPEERSPSSTAATITPAASSPAAPPQPAPPAEGPAAPPVAAENRAALTTTPPPANATPPRNSPSGGAIGNPERFRDYVEAFIVAGLARPPGSEIKFFAENVDYLGTPNVTRQQVQRDLVRYNEKWPHRQFWMDGDIQIQRQSDNKIKLVFPLRYELRNGSRYASGKVLKGLTLVETANNEMQIVAVDEWKAP